MEEQEVVELINEDLIFTMEEFKNKNDIIYFMSKRLYELGRINNYDEYVEAVFERECCFPTSIGHGIAIPHGKSDSVSIPSFAFMTLKEEISWCDEDHVKLVFLIAVPENAEGNLHLKVLANLSDKLMNEEFREELLKYDSKEKLCSMLSFDIE